MNHPIYKYDPVAGQYIQLEKPPRAKLAMLQEMECPYLDGNGKPTGETYTVITDATDAKEEANKPSNGKILRQFGAWVVE